MKPSTYNIDIRQGDTFKLDMVLKNSDGTPVNLTGAVVRMQIRKSAFGDDILADLDSQAKGGITIVGATGSISVVIAASATATYQASAAVYDLELVNPDLTVRTLIAGSVTIAKQVTR